MNNFVQSIKNMSPGRLASLAGVILFLISFFVYLATRLNTTEYAVLYTDLELEDAKQIVNRLETSNIKYKLEKNGTEILVPTDMVNKMRVDTAELALASKGSNVGYEIFDNSDALGSTNFVQNVNLIRALEGELARTVRSVDNIKSARVHLVLPKREMFSKEEQVPTASVVVRTVNGTLSPQSVLAIQKLIAASVPKLDVKNVAIVDSSGNLLTEDKNTELMKRNRNEDLRQDLERTMSERVQKLLEKSVGEGKVRAQVYLEMDFDQVVTNEEIYDPDSQVVRSEANTSNTSATTENNAPVTVAQNIPNGDTVTQGDGTYTQSANTESTVNYEISKIVRNKVRNNGVITRMTTAVVIDGSYERNDEGEIVYRPRSDEEMKKFDELVKSAVGYNAERGDMVEVTNLQFAGNQTLTPEKKVETLILGFTKEEVIRIAEGIGVAIVAILVILLVIRPLINNAFDMSNSDNETRLLGQNAEEDSLLLSNFLNEDQDDINDMINISKINGRVKASSVKRINDIVEKNPDAAVNIVRGWLYQNESNG